MKYLKLVNHGEREEKTEMATATERNRPIMSPAYSRMPVTPFLTTAIHFMIVPVISCPPRNPHRNAMKICEVEYN